MPENLTRREFIKDLGKLGAAAALAPSLKFEEQYSDKPTTLKRPGFIKELEKPTTEIDWNQVKRYNETNTNRAGFVKYVGKDRLDKLTELRNSNVAKWLKEGKPGYTLRDHALNNGAGVGFSAQSFVGSQKVDSPEDLGVPKWTGSPEDASQMVSAALRAFGAATVGFVELDTNTTEKLIYAVDPDGKEVRIEDAEQPEETDEYRLVPKKARWVISYTVQMSSESFRNAPTVNYTQTTTMAYRRARNIQDRLQNFLYGLGYMGCGEASTNALGIAPAFAVLAGLGELSRYNRLLTPEYGSMVRVFKLVTDLPLAPTKPIDAGLMEFCKNCTKCADHCPSKALSFEKEPYWDVKGEWNNPGHKAWFEDSPKCRSYWYEVGTGCGICFGVCPFAHKNLASYHQVQNYLAATVPGFDKTLKKIDDLLYTNTTEFGQPQKDPVDWWNLNLPEYGVDTRRSVEMTS